LPASTIPEVVVSMVIIIVVFGIAMMIYTNVMRMSLSVKSVRAAAVLQEMMIQIRETDHLTVQTIQLEDFRIEEEVKPFQENTDLSEITLTAYDQNAVKVGNVREIIINPDDEK